MPINFISFPEANVWDNHYVESMLKYHHYEADSPSDNDYKWWLDAMDNIHMIWHNQ